MPHWLSFSLCMGMYTCRSITRYKEKEKTEPRLESQSIYRWYRTRKVEIPLEDTTARTFLNPPRPRRGKTLIYRRSSEMPKYHRWIPRGARTHARVYISLLAHPVLRHARAHTFFPIATSSSANSFFTFFPPLFFSLNKINTRARLIRGPWGYWKATAGNSIHTRESVGSMQSK